MKKRLLIVATCIVLSIALLAACGGTDGKLDLDKLNENMSSAKVKMVMTTSCSDPAYSSLNSTETSYMEIDGDIVYTYSMEAGKKVQETYIAKEGDKVFEYSLDGEDWYKHEYPEFPDNAYDNIKEGDLEKDGDYYVLSESAHEEYFSSLSGGSDMLDEMSIEYIRFKISDNKITTAEISMTAEIPATGTAAAATIQVEIVLTYSDFGKVSLTLPTPVEEEEEEVEEEVEEESSEETQA